MTIKYQYPKNLMDGEISEVIMNSIFVVFVLKGKTGTVSRNNFQSRGTQTSSMSGSALKVIYSFSNVGQCWGLFPQFHYPLA